MMAAVRSVIFSSIRSALILQVSASTSTKTGLAPNRAITSAVAAKLNGVVITSSPRPIPNAIRLINKASVPLPTVMQYSDST